ncbi:hypothetical protein SZ64_06735 [Erythrobacter sp. SG61-1L]|uniref:DUF3237 domain-containing protein n=1 Tax=Erythrobacter sp. SG61-1L TaxID=1603897 RepID=UPI0006C8F7DF|nr:DUF3237 domain-containing protein [Erythrobacter sp. SG61-1L]KPL67834.1 hypothetical protein SZ64_06735 [Erythrobacter sp. SG61-1L]
MQKVIAPAVMAAALLAGPALAADAPPAPNAEFVLEEIVKLGPVVEVGKTSKGERRIIPITGGRFEGPGIKGEIVPGGWDWQLTRADGCTEVEADYFLKTDDGVVINVINKGALCPSAPGAAPSPVRTHPVFEAPLGKYEWMSKTAFIGTLEMADPSEGPAVKIRFYKMK